MADRIATRVTASRREKFLKKLAQTCNVSAACRAVRVARETLYKLRATDQAFAAEWDEAKSLGFDALEDEAARRAVKESDRLLIFLLESNKAVYRKRLALTGPDGGPIQQSSVVAQVEASIDGASAAKAYLQLMNDG